MSDGVLLSGPSLPNNLNSGKVRKRAMAFIPAPNAARVAITMMSGTYNTVNTLWFTKPGGYDATALNDLLGEVLSFWGTEIMPVLCTATSLTEGYALDASDIDGPSVGAIVSPAVTGGEADTAASLASAMTITFRSAARGRSGRGRNYISGWGEDAMTQANFGNDERLFMNVAWTELETYLSGTGSTHVVMSFNSGGSPRAAGVAFPVLTYRANAPIYSQRLRTHS